MSEREGVEALRAELSDAVFKGAISDLGNPNTGFAQRQIAEWVVHSRWLAECDADALAPVRALAEEMGGDDCECERYWTRRLARVLPPERLAGEAGAE